ncbi:MAG TPA: hypothetical protein VK629_01520 [Steroidobacteraceae bacterium]|nr:hypothetical protein [Steroidobacteraceae bacterium]
MPLIARDHVLSLKLRAEELEQARQDALAKRDAATVEVITMELQKVESKWNELFEDAVTA